jgi:Tat protein translocase TatB subunit
MFGSVGGSEFLLIAVLALLLFGPRKLPEIGRSLGRALAEFRGVTREFKTSLEQEVRSEELIQARDTLGDVGRETQDALTEVRKPTIARAAGSASGPSGTESAPVKPANGERTEKS